MIRWMTFALFAITTVALIEPRAIPAEPVSVMMDPHGNPVLFLREKRTPVAPYPHRAMMFTGYYRPTRRTDHGDQATGVFAQGNSVSGGAFLGGARVPHLKAGPEPIEEPEVSSAEAEASPEANETGNRGEEQQKEEHYRPEQHHQQTHRQEDDEEHRDELPQEPELEAATTEAIGTSGEASTEMSLPPKRIPGRKDSKAKTPVLVNDDENEDYDEEDEPVVPFVPFRGSKRPYPNLNNFFPMVFSFPGVSSRRGSSGSVPGAVTAIANSYSTGKGGVASSVATAYGGSPNGKKRRNQSSEE